jgi:hypothetical protein
MKQVKLTILKKQSKLRQHLKPSKKGDKFPFFIVNQLEGYFANLNLLLTNFHS